MRTTKPISTISYNTPSFLELKLNELLRAKRISFWSFIEHLPEDDEGGKKRHCHLYIEPSKMLQTDDIKQELQEYDPEKPDKPKGCIGFRSSDFGNWYMYSIHDKRYLASKGESRKYHYRNEHVKTSDEDELNFKVKSIDLIALSPYSDMIDAIANGVTWEEYFCRGTVPIPQLKNFQNAWYLLLSSKTNRGGRPGHENIDLETGEVIEPVATEMTEPQRAPESLRRAQESRKPLYNKPDNTPGKNEPQRAQESPGEPKAWYDRYEEYEPEGEELPY